MTIIKFDDYHVKCNAKNVHCSSLSWQEWQEWTNDDIMMVLSCCNHCIMIEWNVDKNHEIVQCIVFNTLQYYCNAVLCQIVLRHDRGEWTNDDTKARNSSVIVSPGCILEHLEHRGDDEDSNGNRYEYNNAVNDEKGILVQYNDTAMFCAKSCLTSSEISDDCGCILMLLKSYGWRWE